MQPSREIADLRICSRVSLTSCEYQDLVEVIVPWFVVRHR